MRDLRRRAQAALDLDERADGDSEGPRRQDVESLVQELRVHQTELEMQNDELRRARSELQAAHDRYRALYELAPVGYLTLEARGHVVEANLRAAEMLDTEREELLGAPLQRLLRQEEADHVHRHLKEVLRDGARCSLELELEREDGRRFPLLLDSIAVQDGSERPRVRTAIVDLTSKREAEEELLEREARLRAIVDTATDGIMTLDVRGVIETCNRAASRMFGCRAEDVVGESIDVLIPDLARCLWEEEGYFIGEQREVVGLRRDGRSFPLEIGIGSVGDGEGRRLVAILHDITGRKRRDAELRESLARFRQIAERIEDVFYIAEAASGRMLYVSPAFEDIFGRSRDELYGSQARTWGPWIRDDDRDRVREAWERMRKGDPFDEEYRLIHPDGDVRVLRDRAFPIRLHNDRFERVTGIVQDVTDERKVEEELRQAQKMEAIGTLASGIAHDFNNLLMAVTGCSRVALANLDPGHPAYRFVRQTVEAAGRGASLTRQLLNFSRKRTSQPEPLELDWLVDSSRELLERLLGEHIRVRVEPAAPGFCVLADAGEVEQVLMNLAANARDAMPSGGELAIRTHVVELGRRRATSFGIETGRYLTIEVADTGCGMDEAIRERLFEPFFTTKGSGRGTGLGLSTAFAIVRQLGGHITVESESGSGTTFTLFFPVHEERRPEADAADDTVLRGSGTVLLVEDERLVRMTVRHYLEALGYEAVVAATPTEALRIAERRGSDIDVLLTDVVMPDKLGGDLAREVRARCGGLRVLFMSAHAGEELADFGRLGPNARLLQKPFDERTLGTALQEILAEPAGQHRGAPPEPGEGTILLVEDSDPARLAMREYLEDLGYQVLVAARPSEALRLAERHPVDLLLTDYSLPEIRGSELAERLRQSRPDLHVIILSGRPDSEVGSADATLEKPLDLDRLGDEVRLRFQRE